jgi:hypothetical protein
MPATSTFAASDQSHVDRRGRPGVGELLTHCHLDGALDEGFLRWSEELGHAMALWRPA